jgi:predicted O-methyltransferase YrrM
MSLPGKLREIVNIGLQPLNMRLTSLTAERAETARLLGLDAAGQFDRPAFSTLPEFTACDPKPLLDAILRSKEKLRHFDAPSERHGYSFSNSYFTSPDAEVAYALIGLLKPRQIVEVGSGHSTHLLRAAIADGALGTRLVSIDPLPRRSVKAAADHVINERVEQVQTSVILDALYHDDVLFIDSSHEIRIGNDVVILLLNILPALRSGVVVHLHDIFLPFEYPRDWIVDNKWGWNEQYLVQALLQGSAQFAVLWPGHYLQRTYPGFSSYFACRRPGTASSLWLRKS